MIKRVFTRVKREIAILGKFERELSRIQRIPRFTGGVTNLLGTEFLFVDSASFLYMYKEIFNQQIYKFNSIEQSPFIIDAGANIGLSIVYFKKLFPECRILGFEADPAICEICKTNIQKLNVNSVDIQNLAIWDRTEELVFSAQGADGGRISDYSSDDFGNYCKVSAVPLSNYLREKVGFLKIDIEGAETKVLVECCDYLHNVERLFVEYHSFKEQEQSLDIILGILKDSGFRVKISSVSNERFPFVEKEKGGEMDMQLNIFALRN